MVGVALVAGVCMYTCWRWWFGGELRHRWRTCVSGTEDICIRVHQRMAFVYAQTDICVPNSKVHTHTHTRSDIICHVAGARRIRTATTTNADDGDGDGHLSALMYWSCWRWWWWPAAAAAAPAERNFQTCPYDAYVRIRGVHVWCAPINRVYAR